MFIYITAFSAVMIFVIWLFQIVFLDAFYRQSKISELKSSAETISSDLGSASINDTLSTVVEQSNLCALITNLDTGDQLSVDRNPNCSLHHLSSQDLAQLYLKARNNGGSDLTSVSKDGRLSGGDRDESIIYTLVTTKNNQNYVIMLNAVITPVNATVSTLRSQLIYLTVIFAAASLIFALIFSKKISQPIVVTNESAKELADGNVEVHFEGEGYREITELNDTLNYAARELSKVEKLQRELIANVSHDLRTPLTMITGYAEVIRDLPGENTPENIQIIIDEANRLAALVSDVLDISKLQSGAESLDVEVFSITDMVRQIMHRYEKLTEQDGYQIRFDWDQEIYVQGDELKITQVVYNLVNNAIHYTGADKLVVISQTLRDGNVRISVKDTGEGIPPELLDNVWERYYKIDKNHTQSSIGTGLGLSIVKNILTLHHMPFGVDSTPGQGSTFWFEMPVAKA
jgi:signal transduction histidine kinase